MARQTIIRVPYKKMARAKKLMEKRHPDAAKVVPLWSNNRILAEVWDEDGHADIHVVFEDDTEDS